jgi:DNA polymerase-3 subunit gamma/tau
VSDPAGTEPAPYQSLYRRFRPQRFDEVLGQEHVSLALRNAVRDDRVGHAYLFSGPRGTGKTSTARILAKALNCAAPVEGEPCGTCDSCIDIARGASLDVHELDAASNNGVDAMRDLVSHAALGTPGRWKVYIVDEVHMLSTAASNALLKTLEEPPGHVVFVLATTDAQKVLATIRSRTQHYEFRLLGSDTLSALLRSVRQATGLALPDAALDAAVRRGRGSARDALSALDQVAAGGTVDDDIEVLAELAEALAEHDPTRSLVAVAHACEAGRDPPRLAADLAEYLRQGFLSMVAGDLVSLSGAERVKVEETARRMGLPALVRCLEELGRAQVDMRDIPDTRVHLEVALIKLTHPQADDSTSALLERIERLERALAEGVRGAPPAPAAPVPDASPSPVSPAPPTSRGTPRGSSAPASAAGAVPAPSAAAAAPDAAPSGGDAPAPSAGDGVGGPDLARRSLGALRRQSGGPGGSRAAARRPPPEAPPSAPAPGAPTSTSTTPAPKPAPSTTEEPASQPGPAQAGGAPGALPSRDELVQAWGDGLLASLPSRARARFRVGRFLDVVDGSAVFALPNETHRSYCEEVRLDVESALRSHFATQVPVRLVVDEEEGEADAPVPTRRAGTPAPRPVPGPAATAVVDDERDFLDPEVLEAETEPAGAGLSPEERLKQAFPGAHEV